MTTYADVSLRMDFSMELMDLLNVQSLARGNSGATGMEFNAQYIQYNATPKQGLWLCVC